MDAAALCHNPAAIRHAINGCADLWSRNATNADGHPTAIAPREGKKVATLQELPRLAVEQREHYLTSQLNRIDDLLRMIRRRRA